VPGLVAIDLAQAVMGTVLGEPRPSTSGTDVDGIAGHVRGPVRSGHPPGRNLARTMSRDRLIEEAGLVLPRSPPTGDEELDPTVTCSIGGVPQRAEKRWIEIGDGWIGIVEHCDTGWDLTAGNAKPVVAVVCGSADRKFRTGALGQLGDDRGGSGRGSGFRRRVDDDTDEGCDERNHGNDSHEAG